MTGDELRAELQAIGISQSELARRLGMRPQVINRWVQCETPVPPWVPYLISLLRITSAQREPQDE